MNDDDFKVTVATALGRIEQKIDGHAAQLAKHVADDAVMAADIKTLQITQAKQRGFLTAISGVGTLIGAGVGYAIDLLARGGHH